jgi:cytidine deaminase
MSFAPPPARRGRRRMRRIRISPSALRSRRPMAGASPAPTSRTVFAAVLAGARPITAVAVTGPDGVTTPPCGACRQVLAEFAAPEVPLSYARADGGWNDTTLGDLLPAAFEPASLEASRGSA